MIKRKVGYSSPKKTAFEDDIRLLRGLKVVHLSPIKDISNKID